MNAGRWLLLALLLLAACGGTEAANPPATSVPPVASTAPMSNTDTTTTSSSTTTPAPTTTIRPASGCVELDFRRDINLDEQALLNLRCVGEWALAIRCWAGGSECTVDATKLFQRVEGRWQEVGYSLQTCVEDLTRQGVPTEIAEQFEGFTYCFSTPPPAAVAGPECSEAALYEALDPMGNGNVTILSFSCEGTTAVVDGVGTKSQQNRQWHLTWDGTGWRLP